VLLRKPSSSHSFHLACHLAQVATGPQLLFHTHTILESLTVKALQFGSTFTGGNFNSVQDWLRGAYVAGGLAAALAAYRAYSSMAGERYSCGTCMCLLLRYGCCTHGLCEGQRHLVEIIAVVGHENYSAGRK
jgi:hypothetical protein